MGTATPVAIDTESLLERMNKDGYAVLEGVLSDSLLQEVRSAVDEILERERRAPVDFGDGPSAPEDAAIEKYIADSYDVSRAEMKRVMRRIRHTRAENYGTPWPIALNEMHKTFLHAPTLYDQDKSQRIWNLVAKAEVAGQLIEHPTMLPLLRRVLGADCVLSEGSANVVGPHTAGGAWHVDSPLTQLPEPLPDFPVAMQNVWMLEAVS